MKQNPSEMSLRQIFLLLGMVIFTIAGFVQLVMAFSSPRWSAWLAPVASWALTFLAYRGIKKLDKKDDHVA